MLDELEVESSADEQACEVEEEGSSPLRSLRRLLTQVGAGALFLAALYGLFWNEGHGKRASDSLREVAGEVRSATADRVDPALEGGPVHLTAEVRSDRGVNDVDFGLSSSGVGLYRHVEMYQWVEYEYDEGRGRKKKTQVEYELDWHDEYQDSSQFQQPDGHTNPQPALTSRMLLAEDARFGPYRFDNNEIAERTIRSVWSSADTGVGLSALSSGLIAWLRPIDDLPALSPAMQRQGWYRLDADTYYRGNEHSDEPELGDLTANFIELRNGFTLSMIAMQHGDQLRPWRDRNGKDVLLITAGSHSAEAMIAKESSRVAGRTRLLRIIGLIVVVLGAAGMAAWLTGFLVVVPVVGEWIQSAAAVFAAALGLLFGLLAIAIGWLVAHPIAGAAFCLAVAALIVWGVRARQAKRRSAARAQSGTPTVPPLPALAAAATGGAIAAGPVRSKSGGLPRRADPVRESNRTTVAVAASAAAASVRRSAGGDPGTLVRVAVERHGALTVHRMVRRYGDGREQSLYFELVDAGKRIKRSTLEEIRELASSWPGTDPTPS